MDSANSHIIRKVKFMMNLLVGIDLATNVFAVHGVDMKFVTFESV